MKKIIAFLCAIIMIVSVFAMSALAYGMGGVSIKDSSGTRIGGGSCWNEPDDNGEFYVFGAEMTSNASSTHSIILQPKVLRYSDGSEITLTSSKGKSNCTYSTHSYTIDSEKYFPLVAKARFSINGTNSATFQYSNGWNWG